MNENLEEKDMTGSNLEKEEEIKLNVPYFSQYLDIPDDTLLAVRACGMTCVKMCLEYFNKSPRDLSSMVKEGMAIDENGESGYGPSGWKHDYFISLFEKNGLKSSRWARVDTEKKLNTQVNGQEISESEKNRILQEQEEKCLADIIENLSNPNPSPTIVSCDRKLFDENIFHMVLVIGLKKLEDGSVEGFYIHDPAKVVRNPEGKFVKMSDFLAYWRKMAIFVSN